MRDQQRGMEEGRGGGGSGGVWRQNMGEQQGQNVISIYCTNMFMVSTAFYLFWVQGKHSASVCEYKSVGRYFSKTVCEQ